MQSCCHNIHNLKLVRSGKSQINLLVNFSKGVKLKLCFCIVIMTENQLSVTRATYLKNSHSEVLEVLICVTRPS